MKYYISIILIASGLFAPITGASADSSSAVKILPQKFIFEIYEDGKKRENRFLYADVQIISDKEVEWTTVFLDGSHRCIKKDTSIFVPVVSRWDKGIRDVIYDKNSFRLKLVFPLGDEEMLVRGIRIGNSPDFKIEGIGFRKDVSTNKNVKIEWKSIPIEKW